MPSRRARTRRAVALAATATVAGGCIGLTAPAAANAAPATCKATFNLFIPGTWETSENADPTKPVGMLAPVAESIEKQNGANSEVYTLPYMARAFDNGHTYADSKADGTTKADQVLSSIASLCPQTKFTLTGYSQGAEIAGDIASAIGNGKGPIDADRVLAVGLLADPGAGTKGESAVGPHTSGEGIANPRPQGMGTLSGRVASICSPSDLYCSIQKGNDPLLGALGSVLSKAPSGTESGGDTQLATALTSNFDGADLPGLGGDVASLGQQLSAPSVNVGQVASTASTIVKTLAPMTDLIDSGTAHAASAQLAAAPADSPQHSASEVLTNAGSSDLSQALNTVTAIANAAGKLDQSGTSSLPSTSPEMQNLAASAGSLGGQVAPLASTPADALSAASSVLSVLKPTTVVDQALNVATGVTSLDLPAILHNLTLLPQKVAALDARGAHQVAGDLNNEFSPLVKMAAGVNLKWISQILAIIPDPSGYTQIAALVANILSNVDVIRLANDVGQIQEVAWNAVEKLVPPPGQAPDPVGAAAAMTGLLPIGLDLAQVATGALTGTATKTSPQLLGTQSVAATGLTDQARGLDLAQLAPSLAAMAKSPGANDLADLASEGLKAASFFASGAHTKYASLVVDNAGRTAIQWLSAWLNLQIGRAV